MFNVDLSTQACHRCGEKQTLMGSGWMCLNNDCEYMGIVITDIDWTDDYDGEEEGE